ncbi:MAG: threonylcarbamoyl-AMP synthase [Bacteroidales bacterium]|nr:threonylcarbamoyl-AMP synthase [Bacteroidales bacterium]
MTEEIQKCVDLLLAGKIILYPTDTVWGIGCDATNEAAVRRVFDLKQRQESKSMLVLLDRMDKVPLYVERIPLIAWDLVPNTDRPTTFIYPTAKNLPANMIPHDGTIAIRIVSEGFCCKLIHALDRPLVSTSANISGTPSPATFSEIAPAIRDRVDYCVPEEFSDSTDFKPSRIIKFIDDYNFTIIRE